MTVRDLILRLAELPPDLEVVVNLDSNELGNGKIAIGAQTVEAIRYERHGLWRSDWYPEQSLDDEETRATLVNIHS